MEQVNQCGYAVFTKRDKLRAWLGKHRSNLNMFCYGVWWGFLWKTRLAPPYARFMCRKGWYRKYHDGRCMYCGDTH